MNKFKEIEKLRKQIDKVDSELIKVLAKRFKITSRVRLLKIENNLPIEDKGRELKIMDKVEKIAKKSKLNPEPVKEILKLIIKEVKGSLT